jgi:hypothetical protein
VLGARTVIFKPGQERLAIVDSPLKV